jgi:diguanylate cyclase (GGDEF)-like protein/PAS domain S-box-containing protein
MMEGAEFRNICIPGAGRKDLPPGSGEPGERWALAVELIEASPTGIMLTDLDAAILAVNPAFSRITGFAAEEVVGKTPRMLASGRHRPGFYRRMWRTLAATGRWQGEVWNRRKNDQVYPQWLSIFALRDSQGSVVRYAAMFTDITTRKYAEGQLRRLATHDGLTGLPNRALALDRLSQALARARRNRTGVAVLFLDLDLFKQINDAWGHEAGDSVLKEVARRLKACVRRSDTVARLGGDEFLLVLSEAVERRVAEAVAAKVVRSLSRPIAVGESGCSIGVSIGISLYPQDGREAKELIRAADAAMYADKQR